MVEHNDNQHLLVARIEAARSHSPYLVMEATLLWAIAGGTLGRRATLPSPARSLGLATLWLMAAATQVPFIRTIEPAAVIEDPAMMLTFLCAVMAATCMIRWIIQSSELIGLLTGIDARPARSWLLCYPCDPTANREAELDPDHDPELEFAAEWSAPQTVSTTA